MIAQFALRLVCGMGLTWCVMPRSRVTSGFFRIQLLITLGLSVLAALTLGQLSAGPHREDPILSQDASQLICIIAAAASFLGSVMWTLERRSAGTVFGLIVLICSTTVLLFSSISAEIVASPLGILILLSELSTSTMVGGALAAMLLGHWYLTAPTMSIDPLKRLALCFGIAAAIRLLLSAVGLGIGWTAVSSQVHWLWLSLRWLAGIAGPLAVAFMASRILRYRNTQSATGVLFVGVILTFIGELSAALLYEELASPF